MAACECSKRVAFKQRTMAFGKMFSYSLRTLATCAACSLQRSKVAVVPRYWRAELRWASMLHHVRTAAPGGAARVCIWRRRSSRFMGCWRMPSKPHWCGSAGNAAPPSQ